MHIHREKLHNKKIRFSSGFYLSLILLSSAFAVIITIAGIKDGITTVFPHIYYIPIIFASYIYLNKGFYFSVILTAIYLSLNLFFYAGYENIFGFVIRSAVFITVSFVIVSLRNKQIKSEKTTDLIFNNITESITFLDEDLRVVKANESALMLSKMNSDEIIGESCHKIFFGRDLPCKGCIAGKSMNSKMPEEMELKDKDGNYFYLRINPIKNSKGKISGFVESIADITALKDSEKALIRTNKKINLLSSITRHDILNQVTAIKLAGELISMEKSESAFDNETLENLASILNATDTIKKQIVFTKDYEELGTKSAAWQNIDEAIERISKNHLFSKIKIKKDFSGLEIFADPMLDKVIFNIFDNSVRHGKYVTEIDITFSKIKNTGILTFKDNGKGISSDMKDTIFEKGVGKNTGFGLYLTKEILDITGISISENGKYNEGAKFELSIPENNWRIR